MKRGLRLLLWPGMLILLVIASLAVNVALFVAAASDNGAEPTTATEANE